MAYLTMALRPITNVQTYRNLLYLLASLPLGIIYFTFLVAGLSVGVSLLVILAGIPILVAMLFVSRQLGAFERELAIWWLGIDIPPILRPRTNDGLWSWIKGYLTNQFTWTSLAYLLLKLLVGALSFAISAALIHLTTRLLMMPVQYVIAIIEGGQVGLDRAFAALALLLLGLAVGVASLHIFNLLAWGAGRFAWLMLGGTNTARQLAQAQEVAEHEQVRAERAERGRRELIVNVGHELRTPAASIRGHVESLLLTMDEAGNLQPSELKKYLGIVHKETERLSSLIDELLLVARADAGELRVAVEPVAVDGVIDEVYQTLAPLARRERQITLARELDLGLPRVLADRQRLAQVLLNLVRNGITYTPAGGIVSIKAECFDAERLVITVADTGVGIPKEDLERVFERFYRTDESRARTSGGFGLGLAIVWDLVRAMGGSVTVDSTPGEGSRFHVMLPVAPSLTEPARRTPAQEAKLGKNTDR